MAQECPRCGLVSPHGDRRCDCGYDFVTRADVSIRRVDIRALLFSFEGRIGRWSYWVFLLAYIAIDALLFSIDHSPGMPGEGKEVGLLSVIFSLLAVYPCLAVCVKRCHDRDRAGWFMLVALIPIVNLWPLIELSFLPGTIGANRFGLPE